MSTLDLTRLRKIAALMNGGATEGERAAARKAAERIAAAAGMTLAGAMSKLDAKPQPRQRSFFDGFDDWMEEREPGWKAEQARKKREREARDNIERARILQRYGTEEALFARTAWEAALDAAIEPLATWDFWTDKDGTRHRFAAMLDGRKPHIGSWHLDDITPAIREAVTTAYPWPSTLDSALHEVKMWDRLRWDRGLFNGGEWNHYAEVECRIQLLESDLTSARPAASWDDVQARFDWKRYEHERAYIDPTERKDPFLDRLEADFDFLRDMASVHFGHRTTTADKQAAVLSMLDSHPDLSDREIARRVGVSPQTVNNWRKRKAA